MLLPLLSLLSPLQDPAPAGHSQPVTAIVEEIRSALRSIGDPLEVVDVVEGVEGRYGAFADLDGDGDLDYVATEMSHRREEIALHIRGPQNRWRRSSVHHKSLRSKHPLVPWVISNDGTGHAGVLVPTGWPPYLTLLRTDGRGRFRGPAVSLESALPKRLHRSGGVDDMPYEITSVIPASEGHAARVLGEMHEGGDPERDAQWQIVLSESGPIGNALIVPSPADDVDWSSLPESVNPVTQPHCGDPSHHSLTRRSIMSSQQLDLDEDGVLDLIYFTGDFAAHVFLGARNPETGLITYDEELPGAEPLPIEDAFYWFWDRMESFSPEGGYASNTGEIFEKLQFTIRKPTTGDARFLMYGEARKSWLVEYYWTGKSLIPLIWYRNTNPKLLHRGQDGWWSKSREQLVEDWDRDGAIDTLVAGPFRAMRWIGERPEQTGGTTFIMEGEDFKFLEPYRYALIYHAGAYRSPRTTLCFSPKATGIPEDRHMGLPLEIARVPVFRGDVVTEERICVFVRSLRASIFLAPRDHETTDAELFRTWIRRGEQAFVQDRYFVECDARIGRDPEEACVASGERTPRGHQRALYFFEQAIRFAQSDSERADLHHLVARCHSRRRDLKSALESYAEFVSKSGTIEPLNIAHADLTWLFSQPKFRDWHAWRSLHAETRVRTYEEHPGREEE